MLKEKMLRNRNLSINKLNFMFLALLMCLVLISSAVNVQAAKKTNSSSGEEASTNSEASENNETKADSSEETEEIVCIAGETIFSRYRIQYLITALPEGKTHGKATVVSNNLRKTAESVIIPTTVKYNGMTFDVTEIADAAFMGSYLKEITIENGVTVIGKAAFALSKLEKIVLPDDLDSLGSMAFSYCNSLKELVLNESNKKFSIVDGVVYNKACTKVLSSGAADGKVVLPSTVTKINAYALQGAKNITSVILNEGLKTIGADAFFDCSNLEYIYISSSVITIYNNPFKYCSSLVKIEVSEANTKFAGVDNMLFGKGLTKLYACPGASGTFTVPSNVKFINDYAFCGAENLTKVKIMKNVKYIYTGAFFDCQNLSEVYFEGNNAKLNTEVTSAEEKIFGNTNPYILFSIPYISKSSTLTDFESSLKVNTPKRAIFVTR